MQNKTSKYFKYAIGEIILVVIGILIALQISNWNDKHKEKEQVRNIFIKIIKDFDNTVNEINEGLLDIDSDIKLSKDVYTKNVNKDSLLQNDNYFNRYYNSITGYPDISINDSGLKLLESKIQSNYELNNKLIEELSLLYTENLYEVQIDQEDLVINFQNLSEYLISKNIKDSYIINNDRRGLTRLIFDDQNFRSRVFEYSRALDFYSNKLKGFKNKGQIIINKIKKQYTI